ncbi:MAG: nucleoside triphosphate pyrophosphatase [Phycisphaerae bacterium]
MAQNSNSAGTMNRSPRRPELVLASASPRRAQLMREAGYQFRVVKSTVPEPSRRPAGVPIRVWPVCLALRKAQNVSARIKSHSIVIGADTIVVHDGRIINKAVNRRHAEEILQSLSGTTHEVITGLVLLYGSYCRMESVVSVCRMKKLTTRQLHAYLDSNLWRGKAGAYGIQDFQHDPFVQLISGEHTNVMGLPLETLRRELAFLSPSL